MERTEKQEKRMITMWAKGIDYCVVKQGKKWAVLDIFGNFPLFKTKKEAYESVTNLVLAL